MFIFLVLFCILKFSPSQECGIPVYPNALNTIHFPWIAEIFLKNNDKRICGSTIISSHFATTAAHCIQEKNSAHRRNHDEVYLVANIFDLKNLNDSFRIDVNRIIIHPSWNSFDRKYDGDLALLEFKDTLLFSEKIKPICIWLNSDNEKITQGIVISFISLEKDDPGYFNHYHDKNHNYAKIFNMPIRSECIESQPRFKEIVSDSTFCAGGLNSGQCLETGNSGSSLAVKVDDKFYLKGIVSASFIDFAGCDNYTYTLFTDVLNYKNWIEEIIHLNK